MCVAHALCVQELYEDGGSDGQRANAHALRGLVFATLGKDAEALKDLDAQIKLQPDRPPALGTYHAKPCSALRCGAVLVPVLAHAFGCALPPPTVGL